MFEKINCVVPALKGKTQNKKNKIKKCNFVKPQYHIYKHLGYSFLIFVIKTLTFRTFSFICCCFLVLTDGFNKALKLYFLKC